MPLVCSFSDEQVIEVIRTFKEFTKIAHYEYVKDKNKD